MAKDDTREVSYKGQSIDFGFYGKSLKVFKEKGDIKSPHFQRMVLGRKMKLEVDVGVQISDNYGLVLCSSIGGGDGRIELRLGGYWDVRDV